MAAIEEQRRSLNYTSPLPADGPGNVGVTPAPAGTTSTSTTIESGLPTTDAKAAPGTLAASPSEARSAPPPTVPAPGSDSGEVVEMVSPGDVRSSSDYMQVGILAVIIAACSIWGIM
jgi:hypothetical protein